MKNLLICFSSVLWLIPGLAATDAKPTSKCGTEIDCIIARHVEASGGRDVLLNLKSISRVGIIEFYSSAPSSVVGKFNYRTDIVYPDKLREELAGQKTLVNRGTDGRSYWEWTGTKYESITELDKLRQLNETAQRANRDVLWMLQEIDKIKLRKETPVWAGNSICLEGIKNGSVIFVCFDRKTGLMSAKGNDDEYRVFLDWKNAKPIMLPFRLIHFRQSKKVYEINLRQVEVNHAIDSSRFKIPQ